MKKYRIKQYLNSSSVIVPKLYLSVLRLYRIRLIIPHPLTLIFSYLILDIFFLFVLTSSIFSCSLALSLPVCLSLCVSSYFIFFFSRHVTCFNFLLTAISPQSLPVNLSSSFTISLTRFSFSSSS